MSAQKTQLKAGREVTVEFGNFKDEEKIAGVVHSVRGKGTELCLIDNMGEEFDFQRDNDDGSWMEVQSGRIALFRDKQGRKIS